jgi:hypothetical protein
MKNNTMKKITIIMLCVVMFATVLAVAVTANGAAQASETLPEVKKVKVIPVPWQEWRIVEEQGVVIGVDDIIFFDPPDMPDDEVAIVRSYVVLDYEIPLDDLTWEGTADLVWEPIDNPTTPYILPLNGHVEYTIPTTETDRAVLVRYTVAWASSQDVIECHFVNEAILESGSPQTIVGWLSNFDVHNDYGEPIDNFELEFYGKIVPSDIEYVYGVGGTPWLSPAHEKDFGLPWGKQWLGPTWYGGWGVPPQIKSIPGGIEIIWIDPDHPVQPCEWIHFGVALDPDTVFLTGAKAYLTQLMITTPGKVTGGGQIEASEQTGGKKVDKASFGFNVMYEEGDPAPKGELEYIDHATKMNVHAHDMTKLVVSDDKTKAWFEGTCTIDGVSGTFKAYVEDNGEPGKKDVFKITLSDGYTAGGQLLNGNIQIHKKP